jgi:hypothetical protein
MFDAQLMITGTEVYSPWFARGGDNLTATVEVVDAAASVVLEVEVYTKNSDTKGDGAEASAGTVSLTQAGAGPDSATWTGGSLTPGLLELVRYKFKVTGSSGSAWVLFRMRAPVWFDTVAVP